MREIYLTKNRENILAEVLKDRTGTEYEILRTENGKPYINAPLCFSLSHSGKRAVVALCNKPVGVDLELYKKRVRASVISRFSDRERAEIKNERDFLIHWTAREAYVKAVGGALYSHLKSLEFYGGDLYFDGQKQAVKLYHYYFSFGVATLCCTDAEMILP